MPYRETALEDPDLDKRLVVAATELGQRRNRLETYALVPFLLVLALLWATGRWFATVPLVILVLFGGRHVVRSRALAWADDLARIHGVPKERMRELARTIRFP
jgi:hypothetical protein